MNQFFTSKYKFAEIGVRIERSHTINNKAALTITPSINNTDWQKGMKTYGKGTTNKEEQNDQGYRVF